MNIPTKKLKSGFALPVFGFGTWQMGGRRERDPANDDAADVAAIRAALDAGITHIDTAEMYAHGHTETLVHQAIQNYDRSKIFLVSKVQADHCAYDDILKSCEASLERLGVDYLDLYLLHSYSPAYPLKASLKAFNYLVEKGLVRNIGVANFGQEHLAEAQSYTDHKIVCDQVHYNLLCREPEKKGLLAYCQKQDIFLVAWQPVARGGLTKDVPPIMEKMCEKYQKTPAQIAINWLLSQSHVVTLSKARTIEHLKENLGAIGWKMKKDDIEELRREYPDQQDISDAVPLG